MPFAVQEHRDTGGRTNKTKVNVETISTTLQGQMSISANHDTRLQVTIKRHPFGALSWDTERYWYQNLAHDKMPTTIEIPTRLHEKARAVINNNHFARGLVDFELMTVHKPQNADPESNVGTQHISCSPTIPITNPTADSKPDWTMISTTKGLSLRRHLNQSTFPRDDHVYSCDMEVLETIVGSHGEIQIITDGNETDNPRHIMICPATTAVLWSTYTRIVREKIIPCFKHKPSTGLAGGSHDDDDDNSNIGERREGDKKDHPHGETTIDSLQISVPEPTRHDHTDKLLCRVILCYSDQFDNVNDPFDHLMMRILHRSVSKWFVPHEELNLTERCDKYILLRYYLIESDDYDAEFILKMAERLEQVLSE